MKNNSFIELSRPPCSFATGYLHVGHARTFWTAFERRATRAERW